MKSRSEMSNELHDLSGPKPLVFSKEKSFYIKIWRKLSNLLSHKKYEDAEKLLNSCDEEILRPLFETSGRGLLDEALIARTDPIILSFLVKKIPIDLVQDIISNGNYALLRLFLETKKEVEKLPAYNNIYNDAEQQDSMEKKFIILLKCMGVEEIKTFMEQESSSEFITEKARAAFQAGVIDKVCQF